MSIVFPGFMDVEIAGNVEPVVGLTIPDLQWHAFFFRIGSDGSFQAPHASACRGYGYS
jgi:hypothetical protein